MAAHLGAARPGLDEVVREAAALRGARGVPEDTFAWAWTELASEAPWAEDRRRLGAVAQDGTVLDLGCGRHLLGRRLAMALGARWYVGVDVGLSGQEEGVRDDGAVARSLRPSESVLLCADAVDVVTRCRDLRGIVLVSGVDHDVVPLHAWHEALAAGLAKALRSGSVLLTSEATVSTLLSGLPFEPLPLDFVRARAEEDLRVGGHWIGTTAWVRQG